MLDQRGLYTTDKLADDDLTHDVNTLLRRLGQPTRFRSSAANAPSGLKVHPHQFHELYRYGGLLKSHPEQELRQGLLHLFSYIEENVP